MKDLYESRITISYAVCTLHIVIITTCRDTPESIRIEHEASAPVAKIAQQSLEISISGNNNELIVIRNLKAID